jgi:hypothetical protein
MIRSKISSDKDDLDKLCVKYNWLPNSETIRPKPEDFIKKKEILNTIEKEWLSLKDYILHTIFNSDYVQKNGLKFVNSIPSEWIFAPSTFKYNLCENSNHYILWNSTKNFYEEFPDYLINDYIVKELKNLLNHNNFDFAWYKNPKPTVIDFYHIQIFWIIK